MNCTYVYESAAAEIPRPAQLQTMIEYAETLSDGIDFVRVDLYDVARKIYFGELTNIPESALGKFMPQSWDGVFGDFWELPSYRPQTWRAASRRPWRTSPAPGRSAT